MKIYFSKLALQEYNIFERNNEFNITDKIKQLLSSIKEHGPLKGLGKPEILRHYDPSAYSRRINKEHRLVYRIKDNNIYVISCKGHYKK